MHHYNDLIQIIQGWSVWLHMNFLECTIIVKHGKPADVVIDCMEEWRDMNGRLQNSRNIDFCTTRVDVLTWQVDQQ